MKSSKICLHSKFQISPVDPRVFGGFLEHMGRSIYQGVYDPDCAHSDEQGFRTDVLDALKRLRITAMRYPGGNFVSGYHWLDGVGPVEKRPTVIDLAWNSIEPNRIGTDEFIRLARRMDWTPMFAVNLGTGTPEEARNWVEYCNVPMGTKYADMRADNGNQDPFDVKLWCLGNEMDGFWQLGHVPAEQYAIRAQQAGHMMKLIDRSIELVVCGTCDVSLPTYIEWDRVVLEHVGNQADYISLHRYVRNFEDDTPNFLAVTNSIDQQIEAIDGLCRAVQTKRRSFKRAYLCFDEWNVWYRNYEMNGNRRFAPHLVEEVYNLEDALVVAGFLNSFLRHADSVKIANIAQIVNIIAPILTRGDDRLLQSIFYPFEMYTRRRDGVSLRIAVDGPTYTTQSYGVASYVDASAILAGEDLHVFTTNRDTAESMEMRVDIADRAIASLVDAEILTGPDAKTANSFEEPERVTSCPFDDVTMRNGLATYELPPLSVAALTFRLEG
jgi:alpha-N-arabinofuranosidase